MLDVWTNITQIDNHINFKLKYIDQVIKSLQSLFTEAGGISDKLNSLVKESCIRANMPPAEYI